MNPANLGRWADVRAHGALALAMILVGMTLPAMKTAVTEIGPMIAVSLRFVMVAVLLLPLACWRWKTLIPSRPADRRDVLLLSLFGMVLFNLFLMGGLNATSATTAGILTSTIPASTAIAARFVLGERIGRRGAIAIALAVSGILILNLAEAPPGGHDTLGGNLLVLGAVAAEGFYSVFARRMAGRVPGLSLAFSANLIAALMMMPVFLTMTSPAALLQVDKTTWFLFALSGTMSGLVSVALWAYGSARVPASRAGLWSALMPVAVVASSALTLDERLYVGHVIGLAVVVLSLLVGTERQPSQTPAKE